MGESIEIVSVKRVAGILCGVCYGLSLLFLFLGISGPGLEFFFFFFWGVYMIDQWRPIRYRFYFLLGLMVWACYALAHLTYYLVAGTEGFWWEAARSLVPALVMIPAMFPIFWFFTSFNDRRYEGRR